jgi:MFS family permease
MPILVLGRAVQGFGAGCVPAAAYVVIGRAYPETARPRMFAILATAWVVPGVIGPVVAAQVAAQAGWRWVFLGLIPFTVIAALVTTPAVAAVAPPAGADTGANSGAITRSLSVTAGAALILVALTTAGPGIKAVVVATGLAASGALLLVPALALLTPRGTLTAKPGLPVTVLTRGLLTFAYFAGDAYVPLTLTSIRHTSTTYAGLTLTAATLAWTAAAWIQARLVGRVGPRGLIQSGLLLVLIGLGGLASVLSTSIPLWMAPLGWAVAGFGIGLAYSPISLTTLGWATPGQEGRATSAVQLTDVLGTALGAGAAGAAVAVFHQQHLDPRAGLGMAFALAALVAVIALALSPRLPSRSSPGPSAGP